VQPDLQFFFCAITGSSPTCRRTDSAGSSPAVCRSNSESPLPRAEDHRLWRRHRSEPFVLYVNFLEPHPPYDGPFDNGYKVEDMEMPPNYAIPPGTMSLWPIASRA